MSNRVVVIIFIDNYFCQTPCRKIGLSVAVLGYMYPLCLQLINKK